MSLDERIADTLDRERRHREAQRRLAVQQRIESRTKGLGDAMVEFVMSSERTTVVNNLKRRPEIMDYLAADGMPMPIFVFEYDGYMFRLEARGYSFGRPLFNTAVLTSKGWQKFTTFSQLANMHDILTPSKEAQL